jgi:peptidoglycan/xylan/chitin deacetylase (PgdA/CDA1 family)
MPPAFWELWNDEATIGCTVHHVDDSLDTGDIVAQHAIERETFSTLRGAQLRLDEAGIRLMRDAVRALLDGTARSVRQPPGGRTFRKPTLGQVAALHRKLRFAHPPLAGGVRAIAKNGAGGAAFQFWRMGLYLVFTPRITVLLYHRVSDSARDNLTVGVAQFDRQMELLRKYCQPLPIEQLLACRTIPRARKPLVCVTFDDGYLDNYLNAAPILQRHQIPAAFFVSTGVIGTRERFPHDIRRGNPFIPVMEWGQLREMRDLGFTVGSHTVTHIDCAAAPAAIVQAELHQSIQDIRRELGPGDVIFAYPYGGRQHMTPERLVMVRSAGYAACLSAYGGANVAIDPFNVLRCGIHWEFSDRAFLFRCLGLS